MIATCVFIHVKAEYINEFIMATKNNHENSILESGNIRFDILQQTEDKCKFTFYEVYKNEEAVKEHKSTEHYLKWRDSVEEYMTEPRRGVKHSVLFPTDPLSW
jgi:autoinducer 2-degrading protein